MRGTEVLADPTTALALEAALRRRGGADVVRLCSVDRVLRLQPFPEGLSQHFGLLALVTAGRAEPSHAFEVRALGEHLRLHLRLLASLGHSTAIVEVADATARPDRVASQVFAPLREEFPDVEFSVQAGRARGARYDTGSRWRS